eukprot:5597722-Prymnesium_polylepis.1
MRARRRGLRWRTARRRGARWRGAGVNERRRQPLADVYVGAGTSMRGRRMLRVGPCQCVVARASAWWHS